MIPLPEHPRKRFRTPSPLSKGRSRKEYRRYRELNGRETTTGDSNDNFTERKEQESFAREQTRLNQIQEAEQMREWVSKEDEFVLQQSKKKAHIRVREGRAKNIDWLAVTLSVIDQTTDPLEDEINDTEVDIVDPTGIFEGLNHSQLEELGKEISSYLTLESCERNRRYWSVRCVGMMRLPGADRCQALEVICRNYQVQLAPTSSRGRSFNAVANDVDRLFGTKSLEELNALEASISSKLASNEPIDVEYWEQLLSSVAVYKAKAELNHVYKSILDSRLANLRQQQASEASIFKEKMALLLLSSSKDLEIASGQALTSELLEPVVQYSRQFDPEPLLKLRAEDRGSDVVEELEFIDKIASYCRLDKTIQYLTANRIMKGVEF